MSCAGRTGRPLQVDRRRTDGSERLEPEKVKGQPLCMASYKYL